MRCRWSLMTAVGCCCCCHRCCQRLVLFPRLTPPDWQRDVLVLVASPACFRRSGRAPSWPRWPRKSSRRRESLERTRGPDRGARRL